MFLHLAAWIAMLVPLMVFASKASSAEVWDSFVDAGWGGCSHTPICAFKYMLVLIEKRVLDV